MLHICVSKLSQYCLRYWLDVNRAPSHYMIKWWHIINQNIKNAFLRNFNQNTTIFIPVFALRFQNLPARNSSLKIFKHETEEKLAGPKGKLAGPAQFLVAEGRRLMRRLSYKKMSLKMWSSKCLPICLSFIVLTHWGWNKMAAIL